MRHARALGYCLEALLVYDRFLDVKSFTTVRDQESLNISYKSPHSLVVAASEKIDTTDILPKLFTYQRPRQKRRAPTRKRKRRNYWTSIDNLRLELEKFWKDLEAPLDDLYPNQPPPIPNEYLLNFFKRNDLRWGIAQLGGREAVSHLLDGAGIIPGKWKDATDLQIVKHVIPRMQQLKRVESNQRKLTTLLKPPLETTNLTMKELQGNESSLISSVQNHPASVDLKENTRNSMTEFWTKERVVQQLYLYLESYKKYKHRPSVWMPQLAELSHEGYSKLFNACSRFKKLPSVSVFSDSPTSSENKITIDCAAGLVPFKEWRFFESQLQLFVELKQYLQLYRNGSEEYFPEPTEIIANGHGELALLIQKHGGKVLLAQKLDMRLSSGIDKLVWGPMTLDFAIQLLHFIRSQFLQMTPPLLYPIICMPSEKDLIRCGREDLVCQVVEFGGYENVARRLGLAYFDGKSRKLDEAVFRGARSLWKGRKGIAPSGNNVQPIGSTHARKRKGVAWTKKLVIEELLQYVAVNMTLPIYMPKFSHFDENDRGDLKNAIAKHFKANSICDAAGLIPYKVEFSILFCFHRIAYTSNRSHF
mmetsp:Transcript_18185/g.38280  ORF Transcript_18185/g.38280 Transcript_18185/m.38280 type:complete len:590 (-) Transcript_18185:533-2302(-)